MASEGKKYLCMFHQGHSCKLEPYLPTFSKHYGKLSFIHKTCLVCILSELVVQLWHIANVNYLQLQRERKGVLSSKF